MDGSVGGTKAISAEELKEYLHLPAKEVAKSLGMCLTSLKKVCRQHGIKRWPYRRLKSIDKKIQSLESSMGQGSTDGDDLKRQIDQLHSEKASLPTNYGTAGLSGHASSGRGSPEGEDEDFDHSMPSSPLSCASTTVLDALAVHDDGSSRSTTPGAHTSAFHSVPTSPVCTTSDAVSTSDAAAPSVSAPSTPRASLPAPARGSAKQPARPKASRSSTPSHKPCAAAADEGLLKVEVRVAPHVAAMMARGARMQVQQVGGQTQLHIEPREGEQVVIDLASLASDAVREHLRKEKEGAGGGHRELSDDEMISALVGCAGEKAAAGGGGGEEAAMEMTDSEIALALAGCVGQADGDGGDGEAAFVVGGAEDIFSVADDGPMPWFDEEPHASEGVEGLYDDMYASMDDAE